LSAPQEGESVLDLMPADHATPARIYWPLEQLLVRSFSLPLSEPKMLDAAMLSQEVAELTGEEEASWWLAWHVDKSGSGIAGLVFGLSQNMRREMQEREAWQNCPQLLVDGWERLQARRGDIGRCAVIDEDADGLFFGFISDGVWRGMRRLNRQQGVDERMSDAQLAMQILHSWQAMGMDVEADAVVGRAGAQLTNELQAGFAHWEAEATTDLPDRHAANFELADAPLSGLNFRHGKWGVRRQWRGMQNWKRPLALAAGLLLIWMVATVVQIVVLGEQADRYQAEVEEAFHRGLPNERVMLDPLAQLRQAAGSGPSAAGGNSSDVLRQLDLLGRAWREKSWTLSELNFDGGTVKMSGSAADIDSLNKIRDKLSQESGREVVISDTDLSGGRVSFRMKW